MSPAAPQFSVHVDQNRYLHRDASEIHAIVSVEATGDHTTPAGPGVDACQVIIVDASGSMYGNRIAEAREAAAAAIDSLRDGVHFAIVAGTHRATMVYPPSQSLAVCTDETRAQARAAVGRIGADGGTAMSVWLGLAHELLAPMAGAVRQAILLTDGYNNEPGHRLESALAACTGGFVCHARGVGVDWHVEELRSISSALLGSIDIIPDPAGLVEDFRAMTEEAMGKSVPDVALRVWTPQGATIQFVKQVSPTVEDLTQRREDVDERTGDYPTPAWGEESREYHLCVRVPPSEVGRQMRAAWVRLVRADGEGTVLGSGNVLAEWTDDQRRATEINKRVAHYTGQVELASAIQEGLRAHREGDAATATFRLGRAVQLAYEHGDQAKAEQLAEVVVVEDARSGTVHLKPNIDPAKEMSLDTRSSRTVPLSISRNKQA
ncbi:VWA domain-containing protein [Spiractinospora alimapuensis]|uniref:VWA domain-containing protein n=1 Tax=Spiractinospora alimapuensis TaxID=2820884 RepID=UPI001F2449E3|nr:VWA domain-containing protein [Spiractinospora alimapuensis]QVQ52013.1 VWA domain-containing protein [Spiractinospora alimapuensis]